jgi:DNA-binding transcriptional MerR regulator
MKPLPTMLKISQLASEADTTVYVVRRLTNMKLLRPEHKPDIGEQLYQEQELHRLRFILIMKKLNYSIPEVAEILTEVDSNTNCFPRSREILASRLESNRRRLTSMNEMQTRIEEILSDCSSDTQDHPIRKAISSLIYSSREYK